MNVFYFVRRFPRRFKTARQQKIFSLAQTFLNQGHKIHFVSADQSHPDEYQSLKNYPMNLVHVAPKKISASLSAAQVKPDLALFNDYQMQQMYSAYLYNKWNKCGRILQINSLPTLSKYRKQKYGSNSIQSSFMIPPSENLYESYDKVFGQFQKKAILRSDYYITPNDYIYFLTREYLKSKDRLTILSHGYPLNQYSGEIKQQQYRPFDNRKHFYFLADLSTQSGQQMFFTLTHNIWPLIKKQIPPSQQCQLHIYYSNCTSKINNKKKQFQSQGIYLKGYLEQLQHLQRYKALLYPSRSFTGLKSKVIQSWLHHTPVVTTPIGAEGMFYQTLQAKYTLCQSENKSGFISQRQFTVDQKSAEYKILNYYKSNTFSNKQLKSLKFGGSFYNFSYHQFAKSALQLYKDKQKWAQALKIAHKTLLKNQNQTQLQINLKQVLLKLELAMFNTRGNKQYEEQWKRFLKNKQYQKKVCQYPQK